MDKLIRHQFNNELKSILFHYIYSNNDNDELSKLVKKEPMMMFEMSLSVWNRIIQFKLKDVNPNALSDYIDKQDPMIYREISRIICEPVFYEVLFFELKINDPKLRYNCIHEITVGRVFPNDIHLADIEFTNPYEPIPKFLAKSPNQIFKGLGLLGQQIDRLVEYAKKNNCGFVTLTASSINEYELFKKYGFQLEDSDIAEIGLKSGSGIPMDLKINGY